MNENQKLRAVLSDRARPPRPSVLTTVFAFGWRTMLKIKHVPEQLFDVLATPILFTVMFTYLFGGAIAGSTDAYLQFLLPGILAQTVIFTAVYTGVSLNTDITKGVFDRFRSLPIWRPAPLVGAMLGDFVRYALASLVTIIVGLILGYRPEGGVLGVVAGVAVLIVFSFGVGWIFTLLGMLMRSPAAVSTVSFLVLFPLTFASNIFVDPATMPGWLSSAVAINPVTLLVDAVRGLMSGTASPGAVLLALIFPLVLTAIFAPICAWMYRNKA